jgi:serine/threonine protein kinase
VLQDGPRRCGAVIGETSSTNLQTAAGRHLGPYQLLLQIGRGGMADVFLALAPSIDGGPRRQIVIKQLLREVVEDDEFRAMLLDEGRLATRLSHPNVVRTFAVGDSGEERFLVMEFLDGQTLARIRRRALAQGGVPMAVHLRILSGVLRGIHYLHELRDDIGRSLGVVHRDVTPHNVFVTYDGQVKVVDFGIAKAASGIAHTRLGVVKGKLAYLSPESVRGEQVDRRSDVFSVGLMLWEAAIGQRFWSDHDELTVYRKLVSGDLPLGGPLEKKIDRRLLRIINKAMAVRPEDRYPTAAHMQADLDKMLAPFGEVGSRELTREHVRELFASDREAFHEQVHTELVRIDAAGASLVPLRPRPLDQIPTDAGPVSSIGSNTLRTDMTSSDDLAARAKALPPHALPLALRRAWRWASPSTLGIAAVLGAALLSGLAVRKHLRTTEAMAALLARSAPSALSSAPSVLSSTPLDGAFSKTEPTGPRPTSAAMREPLAELAPAAEPFVDVSDEVLVGAPRPSEAISDASAAPGVVPEAVDGSAAVATAYAAGGAPTELAKPDAAAPQVAAPEVASANEEATHAATPPFAAATVAVGPAAAPLVARGTSAAPPVARAASISPEQLPRAPLPATRATAVNTPHAAPLRPASVPVASNAGLSNAPRGRRPLDREDPWTE